MEKINQGQKITVEHLDGYNWKSKLFKWSIFLVYSSSYTFSSIYEEPNLWFSIIGFIFLIIMMLFILFYSSVPEKFHDKQYTIYFFKEYLLLENFNKNMENHELLYNDIKRIYSQKNGFITIETEDVIDYKIEKKGIKNLKLEKHYIKETNEITEYLNSLIEYV